MHCDPLVRVGLLVAFVGLLAQMSGEEATGYPPTQDRSDLGASLVHAPPTIDDPTVQEGQGLLVREVLEGSTATALSVQPGDVLLELNGIPLQQFSDLLNVFEQLGPGDGIEGVILRKGSRLSVEGIAQPAVRPPIHPDAESRRREAQSIAQLKAIGDDLRQIQMTALSQQLQELERRITAPDTKREPAWVLEIAISWPPYTAWDQPPLMPPDQVKDHPPP